MTTYRNRFVIYTTGISSWGSHDIIDRWVESRRDNLLRCIDDRFDEIYIYHYDPILTLDGTELPDTKENIAKYINHKLNLPKNSKIKEELYFIEPFNYLDSFEYPYIIIDSAHLFSYKYNKIDGHYLVYNNYYNENLPLEKIYNVKSLYIPYPSINNTTCENIMYFKIDENYNVITYCDKLLEYDYKYQYSPTDIIDNIFKLIQNKIYILWRLRYVRVGQHFDRWFYNIKPIIYKKISTNIFINRENLENYENYDIEIPYLDLLEDNI
jgi:regulator of sigma D